MAKCMRDDHAVDRHMDAIVFELSYTSESESSDSNLYLHVSCFMYMVVK